MKVRIRYRRARVAVDWKYRGSRCACCGIKGRLELHHWKYAYKTSEVRKDPELVLFNTDWLCYKCHRVANALTNFMNAAQETRAQMRRLYFLRGERHEPTNN